MPSTISRYTTRWLLLGLALPAACADDGPVDPGPPAVASIEVSPGALTVSLEAPGTIQFTASTLDGAGRPLTGRSIAWSTDNPLRAGIDGNGRVAVLGSGPVVIRATSEGKTGTATLTVVSTPTIASCRLPRVLGTVAFGFPKPPERLRSIDTVRATVVFVDFPDAPAARSPTQVFGILDPIAPQYFSAVSYGRMTLVLEPTLEWFRMSRASSTYGWPGAVTYANHLALLQEAATLAAPITDYSRTDLLVVVTNPDAGAINNGPALVASAGQGITVPGRATTINNATNSGRDLLNWGGTWLNHEVGHLLSLPDLYQYSSSNAHRHVGEWSLMGLISGRGRELTAFERWQLGWIDDDQVLCAPSGISDVDLTPIETAGGLKAVVVPLGPRRAIVVESRRALGFDAGLTQPGPLAYLIDTDVQNGDGTMRVLPIADADQSKMQRTLLEGGSLTFEDVTVTLRSRTETVDRVRVIRP